MIHWKNYKIERANRWIGWSNRKDLAIKNAKLIPAIPGHPVQVRNMKTGKIVWSDLTAAK